MGPFIALCLAALSYLIFTFFFFCITLK